MQYKPRYVLGFEMTEALAEQMDLAEEFAQWQSNPGMSYFGNTFAEKFKTPNDDEPDMQTFIYEGKGGYVVSLEGFEWDKTYCYFRDVSRNDKGWRPFIRKLEKKYPSLRFQEASWSEFV